jgi:hypothetical protein
VAAGCTAGTASDFNGDGVADIAIADPDATVNGDVGAGCIAPLIGSVLGRRRSAAATAPEILVAASIPDAFIGQEGATIMSVLAE